MLSHSCRQPSGFRLFVRLKAEPVNSKENTDGFLDFLPVNEWNSHFKKRSKNAWFKRFNESCSNLVHSLY